MNDFNYSQSDPPNHLNGEKDQSDEIISAVGKGLIFAFFMPILIVGLGGSKLVFPNILLLGRGVAGGMLKFQALYPLLAGIAVIFLAKKHRSQFRAASLLGIALFPLLVLLTHTDVRMAFSELGKDFTGGFSIGLQLIISTAAIFMMLASAYTIRVAPLHRFAGNIAVISGYLYFLALLIPAGDGFVFLEPINYLTAKDPSGIGIFFVTGLASLISLALMIYAAFTCTQIQKQIIPNEKLVMSDRIIRLWVWHLIVYGGAVYYMIIAGIIAGVPMGGTLLIMVTMALIKFIPWIMGLYILIPLASADFMLLKK